MENQTQTKKTLDIFELGKDTYNTHYNTLKITKKNLKNYIGVIDLFTKLINTHKKSLEKVNQEIKKVSQLDKPFNLLKKFEFLLSFYSKYNNLIEEKIINSLENLKKTSNNIMNNIGEYLSFSQQLAMNIKNTSEAYFPKYDKLIESLEETEISIIEEYTKKKYRICLNKQKNKDKDKDKCAKEALVYEREYLNADEEIKEKANNYIDEFNKILKNTKPKMIQLNEDTKNAIINIIEKLKQDYNNFINILDNESADVNNLDNNDIFKKETGEFLNYRIKKDENCEILQKINLEKYSIKIIKEDEKNIIENDNYNAIPKHKKLTKTLIYTIEDIYNIVKTLYEYHFETINKDLYNLDKEKDKIRVTQLIGKILNFNFETHKTEESVISQDEKKELMSLIFSSDDCLTKFLVSINNYRSTGKYEMDQLTYNEIKIIFDKIADNLLIKNNKKIASFLIILSQTFYVMRNNEKYFLQKELKKKEYFRKIDFWIDHLEKLIVDELNKFEEESKRNSIVYSDERKKKKRDEIVFSKIVSIIASINGFELEREKTDNILLPIINKFNLSNEMKDSIMSLVQTHK